MRLRNERVVAVCGGKCREVLHVKPIRLGPRTCCYSTEQYKWFYMKSLNSIGHSLCCKLSLMRSAVNFHQIWRILTANLRRPTTVFLALGWIFSNQFLVRKACFDFHHTRPPFQPMIKFYVLVGFQGTAVTIATVTQSTSFWITSIISKSSQTLGNETFRI